MKFISLLLSLSFFVVQLATQESWTIETKCMGDLTYPIVRQADWDFPGVIISSIYPDGVHGIRADQDIEYFIALESDHSFPAAGSVSPDGQYFAYPVGSTSHHVNSAGNDLLIADYLRIVRTNGNTDETYRFQANDYAFSGIGRSFNLGPTIWFGSDWLYYPDSRLITNDLVNFPSGETRGWTQTVRPDKLEFVSPDGTRALSSDTLYDLENDASLAYPPSQTASWFTDSSAFIAASESTISIFDRNGNLIEAIEHRGVTDIAIAPDSTAFAFWDDQQKLFLADMEQRIIYDLCFQGNIGSAAFYSYFYPNLAWSPDNLSLAFSFDEYLVILDTQTLENQVIDHYSKQVMAWVRLD